MYVTTHHCQLSFLNWDYHKSHPRAVVFKIAVNSSFIVKFTTMALKDDQYLTYYKTSDDIKESRQMEKDAFFTRLFSELLYQYNSMRLLCYNFNSYDYAQL